MTWNEKDKTILKMLLVESSENNFIFLPDVHICYPKLRYNFLTSGAWTGLMIDMYLNCSWVMYLYVLDIRARLMRVLESTTSCKRILLSRARKYESIFKRKFDLHLSVFKVWSWFLSSYWLISAPFSDALHLLILHESTLATPNRVERGHVGKSCDESRVILQSLQDIPCYREEQ